MKLSLYRKYRPQTFDEVVGQDHVARTLAQRRARQARSPTPTSSPARAASARPPWPGSSPRRSTAKRAPKARPSRPRPSPCGVCDACVAIAAATSLDVIEMDAASQPRHRRHPRAAREGRLRAGAAAATRSTSSTRSTCSPRRPSTPCSRRSRSRRRTSIFVLATTEPHKIPETILSRCQRFDFRRRRCPEIRDVLRRIAAAEGIDIEPRPPWREIAGTPQGGFRDAIGTLDQLVTFSEGRRSGRATCSTCSAWSTTSSSSSSPTSSSTATRPERCCSCSVCRSGGTNYAQFIKELADATCASVFLVQHSDTGDPDVVRSLDTGLGLGRARLHKVQEQANNLRPAELVRLIELLGDAQSEIKAGLDGRAAARARPGQGDQAAGRPLARRPRGAPAPPRGRERAGVRRPAGRRARRRASQAAPSRLRRRRRPGTESAAADGPAAAAAKPAAAAEPASAATTASAKRRYPQRRHRRRQRDADRGDGAATGEPAAAEPAGDEGWAQRGTGSEAAPDQRGRPATLGVRTSEPGEAQARLEPRAPATRAA